MLNFSEIISKCIAILLFAVSFIVPATPDGVDVSVTVQSQPQIISVEWTNNTGKAVTRPTYYFEKFEDGEWVQTEFAEGFFFPEIYTQYYPTEGGKITVNVSRDLKEPLTTGTYRITLCYDLLYSSTKHGTASAEFEVS